MKYKREILDILYGVGLAIVWLSFIGVVNYFFNIPTPP
jgi:hypothetical protein